VTYVIRSFWFVKKKNVWRQKFFQQKRHANKAITMFNIGCDDPAPSSASNSGNQQRKQFTSYGDSLEEAMLKRVAKHGEAHKARRDKAIWAKRLKSTSDAAEQQEIEQLRLQFVAPAAASSPFVFGTPNQPIAAITPQFTMPIQQQQQQQLQPHNNSVFLYNNSNNAAADVSMSQGGTSLESKLDLLVAQLDVCTFAILCLAIVFVLKLTLSFVKA